MVDIFQNKRGEIFAQSGLEGPFWDPSDQWHMVTKFVAWVLYYPKQA